SWGARAAPPVTGAPRTVPGTVAACQPAVAYPGVESALPSAAALAEDCSRQPASNDSRPEVSHPADCGRNAHIASTQTHDQRRVHTLMSPPVRFGAEVNRNRACRSRLF